MSVSRAVAPRGVIADGVDGVMSSRPLRSVRATERPRGQAATPPARGSGRGHARRLAPRRRRARSCASASSSTAATPRELESASNEDKIVAAPSACSSQVAGDFGARGDASAAPRRDVKLGSANRRPHQTRRGLGSASATARSSGRVNCSISASRSTPSSASPASLKGKRAVAARRRDPTPGCVGLGRARVLARSWRTSRLCSTFSCCCIGRRSRWPPCVPLARAHVVFAGVRGACSAALQHG